MDILKLLSESFFAQAKQLLFLTATQHSANIRERIVFFPPAVETALEMSAS